MEVIISLLYGCGVAIAGIGLPGLMNTTTVDVALSEDRSSALLYGAGYATTYTAQAGLAIALTTLIPNPEAWMDWLKDWAVLLFALLSLAFLIRGIRAGKDEEQEEVEDENDGEDEPSPHDYFAGMGVALVNFLAVPYLFTLGTWGMQGGYMEGSLTGKILYSVGAGLGVLVVTAAYTYAAEWVDKNAAFITHNLNYFLSGLFAILAIYRGVTMLAA